MDNNPGGAVPEGDRPEAQNFTQGQIPIATRAPNAKDPGFLWILDNGTSVSLYVRSKKSGTWFLKA